MNAGFARRLTRAGRTGDLPPDMNVTPLVDVVLVLLIIFMVVAPQLERDIAVNLPGIFNPDPEVPLDHEPLTVTVDHAGTFYLEREPLDLESVIARLTDAHAQEPLRRLVVRGDERLGYGQVRALFARAQAIGFPGIALSVGERHHHEEPPGP